ncbi:Asp23/Gls24 family envelope stress response protein [Streptomyces sp. 549]|uniref:Asp23/Gls24 family envelope stress response protein n=1 Tax=Streptomyces sp. 549 TaxID=3049076 RepID=UPI0024C3A766|nr:Asp23/Gls24 family envelope stress response protein [Streptomyces sp. 549]
MTDQQLREVRDRLTETAAEAARRTPGVAFLRSDLATVLRATSRLAGGSGSPGGAAPAVRVHRTGSGDAWEAEVDVRLAVHRGTRVLDVSRAVRGAVEAAVTADLPADTAHLPGGRVPRVRVSVIVTGVV